MSPSCLITIRHVLRRLRFTPRQHESTQPEHAELASLVPRPTAHGATLPTAQSAARSLSLLDLPSALVIKRLLDLLTPRDLSSFAATSKDMAAIVNQYWRDKLMEKYNFSSSETTRKSGWGLIYHAMHRRRVFVWGSPRNGRLGLGDEGRLPGIAVPVNPRFRHSDEAAIVALCAGGCYFHALNASGEIYVWGVLDRDSEEKYQIVWFDGYRNNAYLPVRLDFGHRVRSIVCGRFHALAMDMSGSIWHFSHWHTPIRLVCPFLDGTTASSTVVQVECGWTFDAALTADGICYLWWHNVGRMWRKITDAISSSMERHPASACIVDGERIVNCTTADVQLDAIQLPELPELPRIFQTEGRPRLVKVAAADHCIIGLTDGGHVLKLDIHPQSLADGLTVADPAKHGWVYLPFFSEHERLVTHPIFSSRGGERVDTPGTLNITHARVARAA